MLDLPDETNVHILAALPYAEISIAVCVCRGWRELRSSDQFRAARNSMDERGLVVAGGRDESGRVSRACRVLVGGHWRERASLPNLVYQGSSISFRGELVVFGCERDESGEEAPCCLAFNLEANAWRTLPWVNDERVVIACCGTDAVVVALFSGEESEDWSLRSLRPGSAEGWLPIPDPPVDVQTLYGEFPPSFCCVEDVLYVVGGAEDESGALCDALQAYDFSARAWTVCARLPEPRCSSACVQSAGRLFVVGGDGNGGYDDHLASVFSYDPRTDRWRSESPLPRAGTSMLCADTSMLCAVAHEARVVVIGIEAAPPSALTDNVWIELPPLPPNPGSGDAAGTAWHANAASLRLE